MNKLLTLKNQVIYDIDTTILCTSNYNFASDLKDLPDSNHSLISFTSLSSSLKGVSKKLLTTFSCENLKTKENLTTIDQLKINILASLNKKFSIYIFSNVLTYLDSSFKNTLIFYLKAQKKRIINFTSEIEETLYLDYLIVMQNTVVIMEGPTKSLLTEEKIFKKLGFNLPILVELSSGLKYYGVLNKVYFAEESLVDDLCQ